MNAFRNLKGLLITLGLVVGLTLAMVSAAHAGGPGGVGNTDGSSSLQLWLRGDMGVSTDGESVSSWADQSGNGNNASGTRATYLVNQINGQPVVKFNGSNVYSISGLNVANPYTIFTVSRQDGSTRQRLISSGSTNWLLGYWSENEDQFYAGGWVHNPTAPITTGDAVIYSAMGDGSVSTFYKNGQQLAGDDSATIAPGTLQLGGTTIGDTVSEASDGKIAEVIVFGTILNTTQCTLVNNYLSAKYGITLDSGDKYAGDTLDNGDYDLDVIGIGRESDGNHTQAHAAGLVLSGTTFLVDDGDYVLAGHKTGRNYLSSADLPDRVKQRWGRVWYLDRTDGGSSAHSHLTLAFDFDKGKAGGTPTSADNYRLLFRSDASEPFSAVEAVATTIVDDQIVFQVAEASLQDGYYTLGTTDTSSSPLGNAHLVLTMEVDEACPMPGQRITYTLTVENSGLFDATGVVISDTLHAGLTLAGPVLLKGNNGAVAGEVHDLPTLASGLTVAAGERITATFPVTVSAELNNDTLLTNTAAITSAEVSTPQKGSKSIQVTKVVGVVFINELLAANASTNRTPDHYAFSDWIEIYNSGNRPIDLQSYYLSDDLSNPKKWQIPAGTVIEPGGFVLLWADGIDETAEAYHTNFKVRQSGEEVGLFSPQGMLIDSVVYDSQIPDVSFGRQPDGGPNWSFFSEPTPGAVNNTKGYQEKIVAAPPQFSLPGGFYTGSQVIELETTSAVIRYTLDGSIPTITSTVYTSPINVLSTTVIRARTFETGHLPSSVIAHTYFVGESYTLPVVSISTDPDNLWDGMTGIYARHWVNLESPVSLEFYETNGRLGFSLNAGARIYGTHARNMPQKSLAIFARNKYGTDEINYRIFNDKPVDRFKSFVLRNSGNDWRSTMMRDALVQALIKDQMDMDFLAYRPVIVFLNGEYWGIYNIREKINDHYLESNYDVAPDNLDLLESYVHYDEHHVALAGDVEHYYNLLDFVASSEMALPESYHYVKTQMDVNEYLNYQIAEIYSANSDWLQSNVKFWRPRTENGRWRWIIYDTDVGFALDVSVYGWDNRNPTYNLVERATDPDQWESFLFGKLLENPEFRNEFIQRFASHLNTTFQPDRVIQIIDRLKANIEMEMPGHITKWSIHCGGHEYSECGIQSMTAWENDINVMREFANQRPTYVRQHLSDRFGLSGTVKLAVNTLGSGKGKVLINNVSVPGNDFAGIYFKDVPLRLKAIPDIGYRFVGWRGVSSGDSRSISITLTQDSTITAMFEKAEPGDYSYLAEPPDWTICASPWVSDVETQDRAQWDLTSTWVITRGTPLVINEIHYNPSPFQGDDGDYEFVELYNAGQATIDLSGYSFTRGIEFIFAQGSSISAGEYIVIAQNVDTYSNQGYQVFQWTNGGLNNSGEDIRLEDTTGTEIDYVSYDNGNNESLWPVESGSDGPSLALINSFWDNSLPENWKASYVIGGTPGQPNFENPSRVVGAPYDWRLGTTPYDQAYLRLVIRGLR